MRTVQIEHRHGRRVATAVVFALLLVLVCSGTAFAATSTGPAVFTAAAPPDGGTVASVRPVISVTAGDTQGLLGYPYYALKIDGKAMSPQLSWGNPSHTVLTLSYAPKADLAAGVHSAYASVRNTRGSYSTYTWSFTVQPVPVLSSPSPSSGAVVSTDGPVVSATVKGSVAGLVTQVLVDGAEVPSTFNSTTGIVSAQTSGLADDESHDVTVTATNSYGGSATLESSFSVQIYAPLPANTACVDCHTTYPAAHDMSNCPACHGPGSPVGEGWNTPDYPQHSYTLLATRTCESCHSAGYSTVPAPHPDQTAQWSSIADKHAFPATQVIGNADHDSAEVPKDNCLLCHSAFQFYQYGGIVDPSGSQPGAIDLSAYGPVDQGGGPFYAAAASHFVSPIDATGPWTVSNNADWQATKCQVCHDQSAATPHKLAKYGALLDATFYVPGQGQLDHWYPGVGQVGYFDPSAAPDDPSGKGMPDAYQYTVDPTTGAQATVPYADQTADGVQATKICSSCHNPDDQGGDLNAVVNGVDYGPQGGDSRSYVTSSHAGLACVDCHPDHTFAPISDPTTVSACNKSGCHDGSALPAGPGVVHVNHMP